MLLLRLLIEIYRNMCLSNVQACRHFIFGSYCTFETTLSRLKVQVRVEAKYRCLTVVKLSNWRDEKIPQSGTRSLQSSSGDRSHSIAVYSVPATRPPCTQALHWMMTVSIWAIRQATAGHPPTLEMNRSDRKRSIRYKLDLRKRIG